MKKYVVFSIVLALGFAARLALNTFLWQNPARALSRDSYEYDSLAVELVTHGTFSSAYRTPGYPLFLAAIYALVGRRPELVGIVQIMLDVASTSLIFAFAFRTFSLRGAFVGSLAYALNPLSVLYTSQYRTETVYSLLLLGAVLLVLRIRERTSIAGWLGAGALVGANTLVRPAAGPLAAVLLLPSVFVFRERLSWTRRALEAGVFLAGVVLVVAPWSVRNWYVYGDWFLSTVPTDALIEDAASVEMLHRDGLKLRYFYDGMAVANPAYNRSELLEELWRNLRLKYGIPYSGVHQMAASDPIASRLVAREVNGRILRDPASFAIVHLSGMTTTLRPLGPRFSRLVAQRLTGHAKWGVVIIIGDVLFVLFATLAFVLGIQRFLIHGERLGDRVSRTLMLTAVLLTIGFAILPGSGGFARYRAPVHGVWACVIAAAARGSRQGGKSGLVLPEAGQITGSEHPTRS